ncbi:MAG: helix-turn-helix domain-containing protein [Acidiphilium sp.]
MSGSCPPVWSVEERETLIHLWLAGKSIREIAERIGRNRSAVSIKAFRYGLPPRRTPGLRPRREAKISAKCARCGSRCFHETKFQRWCGPCRTWASKEERISW